MKSLVTQAEIEVNKESPSGKTGGSPFITRTMFQG
jgi:hypothetical protein